MTASPSPAQFRADKGDDLNARLAQQRVGVHVAVVGKHDPRRNGDQVGAAVPLGALAEIGIAAGLDDLPLFAAAAEQEEEAVDALRAELAGLDIDSLTPREALDTLYRLKELMD